MSIVEKLYLSPRHFQPGTLNAYLLAAVIVAIGTAIRMVLGTTLPGTQFVTLFPAVIASTVICGVAAGVFAVLMALLCALFFIMPPQYSFELDNIQEVYALAAFMSVAALDVAIVGAMRAAVERSRSLNRQLLALNRTLTSVFEANPDAILVTDGHDRVMAANQRAAAMFRMQRDALIGAPITTLMPERLRSRHQEHLAGVMADPAPREMGVGQELFGLRGDGTEFPVDIQIGPIDIAGRVHAIAIVRDLTEQKALHAELAERREQMAVLEERQRSAEELRVWANAFNYAAIGMAIADPDAQHVRAVNPAFAADHGMTIAEALAVPVLQIYPEADWPHIRLKIREADDIGHVTFKARHLRKDGSSFPVQMDVATIRNAQGAIIYRVATARDITASEKAEEILRHATKMDAITALTGGMAHDFNNLLGVIILNLDFSQRLLPEDHPVRRLVQDALTSARSGADLIRSLLAFARRQPLNPAWVLPNALLSDLLRLLSRMVGENIEIVLDLAPDIWPVVVDPSQLEASIANLIANARDAMPNGGRVTVATSNQHLDADHAWLNPAVKPGDYVMIIVSDTGVGMTAEVKAKVFDPFFTTKELGKGTGLGLSMVLGFVNQSGGHVSMQSEPGVGTTVQLYLPRAVEIAGADTAAASALPGAPQAGNGENVLVVEDNAAMRRAVVDHLVHLDYRTIEVDDAAAALTALEHGGIDLMLTDIMMPGTMDGYALAEQVRARWPAVKVLLTTGFAGAAAGDMRRRMDGPAILTKPYGIEQLSAALSEALGARAHGQRADADAPQR